MAGRIRYLMQTELKKAIDNLIDGLTDEEESAVYIGVPGGPRGSGGGGGGQGLGFRFGQGPRDISLVQNAIVTAIYMFTTLFSQMFIKL